MPTVHTCLWFDADALEAALRYAEIVPDCTIESVLEPPKDVPNTVPGVPILVNLSLDGHRVQLLNGGPHVAKSEYGSLVVEAENQQASNRVWDAFLADGATPSQCGWLTDRFGVSWQIYPAEMNDLLGDPELGRAAFLAMLEQQRIDVAAIRDAATR